jgi:Zn-dependent protease with chaperone function
LGGCFVFDMDNRRAWEDMTSDAKIKLVAGGCVALICLGLFVWFIRGEGRRTREALREAAKEGGNEVRKGVVEGAERAVEKAGELPGRILRDVRKELQEGAGEISRQVLGEVKDVLRRGQDAQRTEAPAESRPNEAPEPAKTASTSRDTAPPQPAGPRDQAAEQEPADPIAILFRMGHKITKSVDEAGQELLGLSLKEEQQVGRERMERLASPILKLRTRPELPYQFLILDGKDVNMFAHIGGYVYARQGLLEFVQNDAELQFILAHEIAHVDRKHAARRMTYAARAASVGGRAAQTAAQLAYVVIAVGYSEEDEFEADAWAMQSLLRVGRSRTEALSALRHLLAYLRERQSEPAPTPPNSGVERVLRQIDEHFRSHPPAAERLRRLEALNTQHG